MQIKVIGVKKEVSVFAVDGREIDIPYETVADQSKKSDNFSIRYWVSDAVDSKTQEDVSDEIRRALAKHITEGNAKEGLKCEVIAER